MRIFMIIDFHTHSFPDDIADRAGEHHAGLEVFQLEYVGAEDGRGQLVARVAAGLHQIGHDVRERRHLGAGAAERDMVERDGLVGVDRLFDITAHAGIVARGLMTFALVGYFLKLAYVLVLSYGLFVNPRGLKWLILKIFRIRFLRRWYHAAGRTGSDIIRSSHELRRAGWGFWLKAGSSTFLSWSSRYLAANALIMAFFAVSDQFLLFARQLVIWIMMLVMPTPGGSGFAEYIFSTYCRDLIEVPVAMQLGAATLIAVLWRLVTYYPYLVAGAIIFPRWIKQKFGSNKL